MKSHGILAQIERYDNEREAYITQLEDRIEELEKQLSDAITVGMQNAVNSERNLFRAICAGAFDKAPNKEVDSDQG